MDELKIDSEKKHKSSFYSNVCKKRHLHFQASIFLAEEGDGEIRDGGKEAEKKVHFIRSG